jgi:Flp pilus assembly protein TadG
MSPVCYRNRSKLRRGFFRLGAAATELAIILPVFILVFLGCVDCGRFVNSSIAINSAVRAGAGVGIMSRYPDPDPTAPAGLVNWQAAVCAAVAAELGMSADFVAVGSGDPDGYRSSQGLYVRASRAADSGGLWRVQVAARVPFAWWSIPNSAQPQQSVVFRAIR